MAETYLRQEDLKALDQTRQRLFQLASNIGSLKADVQQSNPLPQWESLQASASILAQNVRSMTDHLSKHSELFQRTAVYPSTNYPGRTQEGLLAQLIRKKLEPQVETWVDEGRAIQGTSNSGEEEDADELWKWAKGFIGERVAKYALEEAGRNYTAEERQMGIENVKTGLRRKLEDDEEEESEEGDEDEEMEDVGLENTTVMASAGQVEYGMEGVRKGSDAQAKGVKEILRFATRGHAPGYQEPDGKR